MEQNHNFWVGHVEHNLPCSELVAQICLVGQVLIITK